MAMLRPGKNGSSSKLWRLSGLGFEFASQIAAGLLLGWLVDRMLNTHPTWLIVGLVAGVIVGMAQFLRQAIKASRQASQSSRPSRYIRPATPSERPDRDTSSNEQSPAEEQTESENTE